MRKPRDFDAELKVLADKARTLKELRVRQFGELVSATGADALDAETLAGALLGAVATNDLVTREERREAGERFFRIAHRPRRRARAKPVGDATREGGSASA
ncbi:conjugal transfer protein TraD [Sphingosinicella sp. LHD-64]|nr:conjugal transfer protein TraD [Sphingosinicella sp. LHD-64]MDQ8757643.1 conjugal transfer protein TraD [Sphingosinicella sp. LHD-64]